jgi:predicted enzyme related to lactoylglutathione lyase
MTAWGRITILVHDAEAAREFYAAAFGLEGHSAPNFVVALGSDALRVGRQTGGEPLATLLVDDLEAAILTAVDAGAGLTAPATSADASDGSSRLARVRDLYGNEFVLTEPAPTPES